MHKLIIIFFILCSFPLSITAHGDAHDELIIRMTENGFEPKELTVTEGDEVLFINNDDVDRWPASNFHPTHSIYPEFDPLEGIAPGSSWKHTFDKPGTWRMHDHLIPHMTGTIVVLEDLTKENAEPNNSSEDTATESDSRGFFRKIIDSISSFFKRLFTVSKTTSTNTTTSGGVDQKLLLEFKNLDERAKYTWLEERAELEDPKIAWDYVLATYNTPEGVVGNPHDMAHLVGQLLFSKYSFEGLSTCTPVFAFGCYHGLMEVAFDGNSEKKYAENLDKGEQGCRAVGDTTSPTYWSCIHGMGHGVATFRDHDVFKSLSDCDKLANTIRTYCHDGVFMELSISAPPSFYKNENPIYPCDAVGEDYKVACARSQVQVMRLRMNFDTKGIAEECIKSNNQNIIYHCIDALGYFIGQTSAGNAQSIIKSCKEIEDEVAVAQCTSAAAGELVFQNVVKWRETTKTLCNSLKDQFRTICNERVDNVAKSYGRN